MHPLNALRGRGNALNNEKINILVVDDESEIRKIVRLLLQSKGYRVSEAENGALAVEAVKNGDFDLIIMDMMMPDLSGVEATAAIREFSVVPILFLTAKSLDRDKLQAFECGGDDYIVKPFSYAELIMRVEALLRRYRVYRGKSAEEEEIVVLPCGVEINVRERRVIKNGETVVLRDKESAILFYLLEKRGETVDSTELYEAVWEEKAMSTSANNVMVNMLSLRKKLEDDPSNPTIIKTIWGKGYRFV